MCEFNKIDFSFFYPPLGDFIQPCFDTKQNRNNELMKQEVNQEQNISYNLSRDSKHLVVIGFCRFCGFYRFCGFRLKQDSWRQRVTLDYKMKINHIFLHKCNLFVFTSTCLTCSLSCAGLLIRWTYRFHSLWGHLTQTVMKVDTEFNRTSAVLTLPRATNQQLSSAADWNRGRGLRVTDRSRLDEECCNWRGGASGAAGGGWRVEVDSRWSWSARCTAPGGSRTPWGRTCRRSSSSGGDVGSGRWRKLWTDLRRKQQHDENHVRS